MKGRPGPINGCSTKGRQTRTEILQVAVQIASAEGLEGISLGRLADEVGMSKSGLFAHFRSKEELQLAIVDDSPLHLHRGNHPPSQWCTERT